MLRLFIKFFIVFLALIGAAVLATKIFHVQFGTANYWDHRGVFFLVAVALFPRLTLLFSSVASGGIIWWLGWLFTPRFLVACLATLAYWPTNPVLVVLSWLFALGGESSEKVLVFRRPRARYMGRRPPPGDVIDVPSERID